MDDPPSSSASAAVKIDLTAADKTIRRPGSAPDLHDSNPSMVQGSSTGAASGGGRTIKGSLKQQRSLDRNEVKRKSR